MNSKQQPHPALQRDKNDPGKAFNKEDCGQILASVTLTNRT